jgi:hypothetical protein
VSTINTTQREAALRQWARKSSDDEEARRDRTEREIRDAFSNSTRLAGVPLEIYVKGSYANNTNVRLDYDVDVAVEFKGLLYTDSHGAEADVRKKAMATTPYLGPYGGPDGAARFKADVQHTLEQHFGVKAIERGNLSLRVRERRTTLPADVVPCFTYRYIAADSNGHVTDRTGTRLYPDERAYIHNWPKQQYDRGVAKNNATGKRYKRVVRAVKRVENLLVDAGRLAALPSFFMECLVYNVPNSNFNHADYSADMRAVLAAIFNSTMTDAECSKWLEASECKWLFGHGQGWTRAQAHDLADEAWSYLGFK